MQWNYVILFLVQMSPGVQVILRANSSSGDAHTFYGLPGLFGAPLPRTPNTTLHLTVAQPEDACAPAVAAADVQHQRHTAVLAVRGNCSFAEKAQHAQAVGAALLIVYDVQPGRWISMLHISSYSQCWGSCIVCDAEKCDLGRGDQPAGMAFAQAASSWGKTTRRRLVRRCRRSACLGLRARSFASWHRSAAL